jgi:SAM-dependent methyltransferase
MKLHELVFLRNCLQKSIDLSVIKEELQKNSDFLAKLVITPDIEIIDPEYGNSIKKISERHAEQIKNFDIDIQEVQQLIDEINIDIQEISNKFFTDNYQTEVRWTEPDDIRKIRVLSIPEGVDLLLLNRINLHSSWKYPALEIGCRDGEWTKYLVASDPLYVADTHIDFLNSTNNKFVPEYQNRVRKYDIAENKIIGLPENQFSFIFSYNFFNYLSLDSIKQYLSQAIKWLRPGGTMLFTYNNADMSASAGLAESYFMTYVPKSMLVPLCESMGFEVTATQDFEPSTSWIEIKKPGVLQTVRAHQILGAIKFL